MEAICHSFGLEWWSQIRRSVNDFFSHPWLTIYFQSLAAKEHEKSIFVVFQNECLKRITMAGLPTFCCQSVTVTICYHIDRIWLTVPVQVIVTTHVVRGIHTGIAGVALTVTCHCNEPKDFCHVWHNANSQSFPLWLSTRWQQPTVHAVVIVKVAANAEVTVAPQVADPSWRLEQHILFPFPLYVFSACMYKWVWKQKGMCVRGI